MKIPNIALIAVLIVALVLPLVVAEDSVEDIDLSLNESVSGLKLGWHKLGLAFTFNQEKKAQKELNLARLMLIRAKLAAQNNDTEAMDNAIQAHNRYLERVQNRIDKLDSASNVQGLRASANKLVGLERAIEVHEARIIRLNTILSSGNLTDEQISNIEDKLTQAENVTAHLKEVEAAKEERVRTRLMAVGNMTEQEAEEEIEELEEEHNLRAVNEVVAQVRIRQAEKVIANLNERVADAEAEGRNVTEAKAQIADAQLVLEQARTLYSSGNYSGTLLTIRGEVIENKQEIRNKIKAKIASNIASSTSSQDAATSTTA